MSRAAPLPAGLPSGPIEGQPGLLLYQPRASPRRQSTLARICATEREDPLEQRAVLVLLRLKLRRSLLSSQCPIRPKREKRCKICG